MRAIRICIVVPVAILALVILVSMDKQAQAAPTREISWWVGQSNNGFYYDHACKDGIFINVKTLDEPLTGIVSFWILPDHEGPPFATVDFLMQFYAEDSEYSKEYRDTISFKWPAEQALVPGTRIAAKVEFDNYSEDYWFVAAVEDCLLPANPEPERWIYRYDCPMDSCIRVALEYGTEVVNYLPIKIDDCTEVELKVYDDVTISDLDVGLNLSSNIPLSFSATLTSPKGTKVTLFDGQIPVTEKIGASCSWVDHRYSVSWDMPSILLDDDSVYKLTGGTSPYAATSFAPIEKLSAFNGENPTGAWILNICTQSEGNVGASPPPDDRSLLVSGQSITSLVSVSSAGAQGNGASIDPSISDSEVAFESIATNLVSGDTNGVADVFVHDPHSGKTSRVSVSSTGEQGNGESVNPSITQDGRYVVFASDASNLVSGDTNGVADVFLHDLQLNTTSLVSVSSTGAQGNQWSGYPSISGSSRFVTFSSGASNLVTNDTNGKIDVFVRDRLLNTTTLVSVSSAGVQGNNHSYPPVISGDDRFVVFESIASNLVSGDTNGVADVFIHDRETGTTSRVSVSSSGQQGNTGSVNPKISGDGSFVVYASDASNLVGGDTNNAADVFLYNRQTGTTNRVSLSSGNAQGNQWSGYPSISDDGELLVFSAGASNLVPNDTNGRIDVFSRDIGYDKFDAHLNCLSLDISEAVDYSLDVTVNGQGSVQRTPNKPTYQRGESVTLTAVPANGHQFVGWGGDASGSANPIQITMTSDKSITASFAPVESGSTYILETIASGSGSITRNPDKPAYQSGETVILTAVPANGHQFVGWLGDASGSANPIQITMTSDKSITASFAPVQQPTGYSLYLPLASR